MLHIMSQDRAGGPKAESKQDPEALRSALSILERVQFHPSRASLPGIASAQPRHLSDSQPGIGSGHHLWHTRRQGKKFLLSTRR